MKLQQELYTPLRCGGEDDHQDFGGAVDADSCFHVGGSKLAVVRADVGFVEKFAEVVVGTTKAAIEDGGKGGLGIAAVGRDVVASVLPDEFEPVLASRW